MWHFIATKTAWIIVSLSQWLNLYIISFPPRISSPKCLAGSHLASATFWMSMSNLFSTASRRYVFTSHLPHRRWESKELIHRKPRYERPLNFQCFHSLPLTFSSLIFSKYDVRTSCSFFSFINLPILVVAMSENTLVQMDGPLLRDKSGVPAERSHESVTRSLVSGLWSVIRSEACTSWRKTATGDWQPTTGFMAVVSGGRRVSRMDDCRRDFTLPSCALTHTVLPLLCSRWLIFTALMAQQQTRKEPTVQLNIM